MPRRVTFSRQTASSRKPRKCRSEPRTEENSQRSWWAANAATDVALLQIRDPNGLKAIALGNSDALEVGDFVIAVGNPFGLGQTVTSGLVSALGRTGLVKQGYEDFIQTD